MATKKTKIKYPWDKVEIGGGFFIPTLNPDVTIRKATAAAMRQDVRISFRVGVYRNYYGVMFRREE